MMNLNLIMNKLIDIITSMDAIIVYVIVLLIIFIIVIFSFINSSGNNNTKIEINSVTPVGGQIVGSPAVQPTVPVAGTSLQKVDKEKKPKENKTRFYMLSQIDANRSKYQRSSY
ncbi:MAG: hypothetical protein IJE45_04570, partial [Bacilli bacterium]|nr:hypothetical protein [Bacilli bacterium]